MSATPSRELALLFLSATSAALVAVVSTYLTHSLIIKSTDNKPERERRKVIEANRINREQQDDPQDADESNIPSEPRPIRHWKKRDQIWDEYEYGYVDYQPKPPVQEEPDDSLEFWFYVYSRIRDENDRNEKPRVQVHVLSQVLTSFFRTAVGHADTFDNEPVLDIHIFFERLQELQEEFAKLKLLVEDATLSEKRTEVAITFGLKGGKSLLLEEDPGLPYLQRLLSHLTEFMECLELEFEPVMKELEMYTQHQQIVFPLLCYMYKKGQQLTTTYDSNEEKIAFIYTHCKVTKSEYSCWFTLYGTALTWDGTAYTSTSHERTVNEFQGTRSLSDLPFHPTTATELEELTARGKIYRRYTGIVHVYNNGPSGHVGRAMVDCLGHSSGGDPGTTTETYQGWGAEDDQWHKKADSDLDYENGELQPPPTLTEQPIKVHIEDDQLYLLPPTVFGFSLAAKRWCEMRVLALTPVKFDENAWDHLVLDPDVKLLVKSLVDVTRKGYAKSMVQDVITGKGGGLVAVLHGKPGTGKTLTAESVAEQLKRPLYIVGSEELSFEASALESNLRRILNLAKTWDAVLLIDEADVFLEQRSMHDLERNAVVSVALRLLEYHSGVLFLTTNRISSFDEAFLSRFSIGIKYPELDQEKRYTIWEKFLKLAGTKVVATPGDAVDIESAVLTVDVKALASKNFNGRSIKNIVRTSQALALANHVPLSIRHIQIVVDTTEKFLYDLSTVAGGV